MPTCSRWCWWSTWYCEYLTSVVCCCDPKLNQLNVNIYIHSFLPFDFIVMRHCISKLLNLSADGTSLEMMPHLLLTTVLLAGNWMHGVIACDQRNWINMSFTHGSAARIWVHDIYVIETYESILNLTIILQSWSIDCCCCCCWIVLRSIYSGNACSESGGTKQEQRRGSDTLVDGWNR